MCYFSSILRQLKTLNPEGNPNHGEPGQCRGGGTGGEGRKISTLLFFLHDRTWAIASQNKDHASAHLLQPDVAMWLHSGPWDKSGRDFCDTGCLEGALSARRGHHFCLSASPPSFSSVLMMAWALAAIVIDDLSLGSRVDQKHRSLGPQWHRGATTLVLNPPLNFFYVKEKSTSIPGNHCLSCFSTVSLDFFLIFRSTSLWEKKAELSSRRARAR